MSFFSLAQEKIKIDSLTNKSAQGQTKVGREIDPIYPFTLIDYSDKLSTMRQFNEGYLSLYRIASNITYKHTPKKYQYLIFPVQMLASLYLIPLTHEEGHRSVLTNLNVGAISAPLFNKGVAKVTGVTDQTLKNLRDTDLPDYIRLHTAGIESDYVLSKREQQLVMFDQEKIKNVLGEFYPRRMGIVFYYISSAFSSKNHIENEEDNELDRDIVGDDIRGAVRHLHRPTDAFHRYTTHGELLPNEHHYIRRVGYFSLLNLVNPLLIGKGNFIVNKNLKIGFGLGYIMVPFGTMAEENIWIKYKRNGNINVCVRQYSNQHNTFMGLEFSVFDLPFGKHYAISGSLQGWKQPKALSFITDNGKLGGSSSVRLSYKMFGKENSHLQWMSIDANIRAKTEGFVPEDPSLKNAFNTAIGFSICPR